MRLTHKHTCEEQNIFNIDIRGEKKMKTEKKIKEVNCSYRNHNSFSETYYYFND